MSSSATAVDVTVHGAHGPFLMVLGESVNKGWQAHASGATTDSSSLRASRPTVSSHATRAFSSSSSVAERKLLWTRVGLLRPLSDEPASLLAGQRP